MKNPCQINELKVLFSYNAETGEITHNFREKSNSFRFWDRSRLDRWNAKYAGKPALSGVVGIGYLGGSVLGMNFRAHRVAWALHHGQWPQHQIDHINGNRSDNRIDNLSDKTNLMNSRNQGVKANNKSGVVGVFWCNTNQKWCAQIRVAGKCHHLGHFSQKEDAVKARQEGERRFNFGKNHGKRQAVRKWSPRISPRPPAEKSP